ncbi:MAG: hypothetical protein ACRDSL_09530 [Pseudonocardiaceae bacterium]
MDNALHPASPEALRWLGTGAVVVSLALCLVSVAVVLVEHPLGELRRYLDVAEEANLPTWWSTVLLLVAALAHGVAGLAATQARVPAGGAWFVGAAVLAVLSLAEHTGLHHRLDGIGRQLAGDTALTADWLPLGAVAGLGVVAMLTLLAMRLRGRAGRLLGAGGAVLLGCALGGELAVRLLLERGESERVYVLTYHAAELGENVGAALLLAAAMSVLTLTRDDTVQRLRYRTEPLVAREARL